jgi:hypothetical protein
MWMAQGLIQDSLWPGAGGKEDTRSHPPGLQSELDTFDKHRSEGTRVKDLAQLSSLPVQIQRPGPSLYSELPPSLQCQG